jgi:uncharacterized membrane protein YvlD (DUF360 family)
VTLALVIGVAGLFVAVVAAAIDAMTHSGTSGGDAIETVLLCVMGGSVVLGLILGAIAARLRHSAAAPA